MVSYWSLVMYFCLTFSHKILLFPCRYLCDLILSYGVVIWRIYTGVPLCYKILVGMRVFCNRLCLLMHHSGYGLSQRETKLHCNIVSHWLSPYPESPLPPPEIQCVSSKLFVWFGVWNGYNSVKIVMQAIFLALMVSITLLYTHTHTYTFLTPVLIHH